MHQRVSELPCDTCAPVAAGCVTFGMHPCQVACGGYHTLAVCAHDAMQQEAAEKQSGYKKKMMHFFSKPVTVDVPDSRQHSTGPNTAGSGAATPLDRVSEGSLSLMAHGSNGAPIWTCSAEHAQHGLPSWLMPQLMRLFVVPVQSMHNMVDKFCKAETQ